VGEGVSKEFIEMAKKGVLKRGLRFKNNWELLK